MVDLTARVQKKQPKKQKLRNSEYYSNQDVLDRLYADSKKGKAFTNLMELIEQEDNILLAYRNVKNNGGSQTAGTDGMTIEHYKEWSEKEFVGHFQGKLKNYQPKSVRRVEIPKPGQPDKKRPLGIPTMDDRMIQQCILQVLDPICEAKFHNHSYGFRPNRSTEHAIARTMSLMNMNKLHHVVDIDIKGFFDNVNHGKLLKQMWSMGIRDKNLLSIVSRLLKSEIEGMGKPKKGTPQGGILSPLLSNVTLNELDWWLSDQWETISTRHTYSRNDHKMEGLRKKSRLKEVFLVRYADDFKILCRNHETARRIFIATKLWLKERLGLEINPDKSKTTNVRKGKTEFLGLALKVKMKKKKFITRSNITEKARRAMIDKLRGQTKAIQHNTTAQQVNKLNSMILGMHYYYSKATLCSLDFSKINFIVRRSLHNRLKGSTRASPYYSKTYQKIYGDYRGKPVTVAGITIFPIYGCTFKIPMNFTQATCNYTAEGRKLVHSKLGGVSKLIRYLLNSKEYDRSVEYNDNRISLMAGQNGKCGVTSEFLTQHDMECHHRKPKELGGTDEYKNLVWVKTDVHKLIHATLPDTIYGYLQILNLDEKALKKVNSLRKLAGNSEIKTAV